MSKTTLIFILLFIVSCCGLLLLIDAPMLQYSHEFLWHVPYRSFFIMLILVLISSIGKILARQSFFEQGIANLGLYGALSWFPVSLIFSGNVRNIFSASSLVSYDTWLIFSFIPIMCTLFLGCLALIKYLFNN